MDNLDAKTLHQTALDCIVQKYLLDAKRASVLVECFGQIWMNLINIIKSNRKKSHKPLEKEDTKLLQIKRPNKCNFSGKFKISFTIKRNVNTNQRHLLHFVLKHHSRHFGHHYSLNNNFQKKNTMCFSDILVSWFLVSNASWDH